MNTFDLPANKDIIDSFNKLLPLLQPINGIKRISDSSFKINKIKLRLFKRQLYIYGLNKSLIKIATKDINTLTILNQFLTINNVIIVFTK